MLQTQTLSSQVRGHGDWQSVSHLSGSRLVTSKAEAAPSKMRLVARPAFPSHLISTSSNHHRSEETIRQWLLRLGGVCRVKDGI